MGDPKKIKKKYATPLHPWIRTRIEEERIIRKQYGLKTKTEIWKMDSLLRSMKHQAKQLIAREDPQSFIEEKLLKDRLVNLGLISADTKLVDVLSLTIHHVMDRRLQTVLVRKGLARSTRQARQMIVHRHVKVGDQVVDAPSYMVKKDEENSLSFVVRSPFNNADHPERAVAPVGQKVAAKSLTPEEQLVMQQKHPEVKA
ncbi:MAG: 30S ribosomal protein S4 [Nanoarchaeota archaeon]|nr:30S ribosomal protein S4 [Nanoarchaeota archaeon]